MRPLGARGILIPALVTLVTLLPAIGVDASGPGVGGRRMVFDDEPAGPYRLRALTSPTPPLVGNLYIEVRVADAATGQVLTDPVVRVRVVPVEAEGGAFEVTATHDIAPVAIEFAAHLPVEAPGLWRITILVDGPPGHGEASFLERVTTRSQIGPVIAVGAPMAGLFVLVVVFLWLQRNARRERSAHAGRDAAPR